jgi:hypothetical protein
MGEKHAPPPEDEATTVPWADGKAFICTDLRGLVLSKCTLPAPSLSCGASCWLSVVMDAPPPCSALSAPTFCTQDLLSK